MTTEPRWMTYLRLMEDYGINSLGWQRSDGTASLLRLVEKDAAALGHGLTLRNDEQFDEIVTKVRVMGHWS